MPWNDPNVSTAAIVAFHICAGTWQVDAAPTPRQQRWSKRFEFDKEFTQNPTVIVAWTYVDADKGTNLRFAVSAEGVDPKGFTGIGAIWGDTKMYGWAMTWTAFGI